MDSVPDYRHHGSLIWPATWLAYDQRSGGSSARWLPMASAARPAREPMLAWGGL